MRVPLDRCILGWAGSVYNGRSTWHGRIPRRGFDHVLDYAKRADENGLRVEVPVTRPWALVLLLPNGMAKLTIEGTSVHARRHYLFPTVDQAKNHAEQWCHRRFRYKDTTPEFGAEVNR